MTATSTWNGKPLVFSETFKSPFEKDTEAEALKVLDEIRSAHPAKDGWVEVSGYAEHLPNGKWRAVRSHRKYQ